MRLNTKMHIAPAAILFAAAALAGCSGDREAEAETPISEAEVSTELPESVVSDNQLQAAANAAAQVAGTPPSEVVLVPVPTGQPGQATAGQPGQAKAPAQGQAAPGQPAQAQGGGTAQQKNAQ